MQIKVFVTHRNGAEATIEGDAQAVRHIEIMLQQAGARWNPNVETWDFGFYTDTPSAQIDVVTGEPCSSAEAEANRTRARVANHLPRL